jgi:hypothetical protein
MSDVFAITPLQPANTHFDTKPEAELQKKDWRHKLNKKATKTKTQYKEMRQQYPRSTIRAYRFSLRASRQQLHYRPCLLKYAIPADKFQPSGAIVIKRAENLTAQTYFKRVLSTFKNYI